VAGRAAGTGYVSAQPGDVVTLWGTGFGPVAPAVLPGTVPSIASFVVDTPQVSVGGVPAQVVGAALSPGFLGLYQVAIKIPEAAPDGDNAVEVRIGGFSTPQNVFIHVQR
jgi:uncharacterized protein (TIGR03437 family)